MKDLLIVGDIAGNYLTLQALLDKAPKDVTVVSVGDMIDRGPRSPQVIDFFMHSDNLVVKGNHCHLMVDYFNNQLQGEPSYYPLGIWQANGGDTTIKSFSVPAGGVVVGEDVIDWMDSLPLFLKFDDLVITHGPIRGDFKLDQCLDPSYGFNRVYKNNWLTENGYTLGSKKGNPPDPDDCVLWHRGRPTRRHKEGLFQVHGHNANKEVEWHKDKDGVFGVNLDTSRGKKLTGMHWPSKELFEQEYID